MRHAKSLDLNSGKVRSPAGGNRLEITSPIFARHEDSCEKMMRCDRHLKCIVGEILS